MKTPVIFAFYLLLMVNGCGNKKNNCNPEQLTYHWSLGREIIATYDSTHLRNDYKVTDGDNLIFEYNHFGQNCDDVYDDEWGEVLTFEIDKNMSEFEYTDSAITITKCFYYEYGGMVKYNPYQIKNGLITGKKISSNSWTIRVSVLTTAIFPDEAPKAIVFTKNYTK